MNEERVRGEVCPQDTADSCNRDNRPSLQLFGNPVVIIADVKHVGLEPSDKKLFNVYNCEKIEKTKVVGRCLVCYSFIGENEYHQGLLGRRGTEQASALIKFLRTFTSQPNLSIPFVEKAFSMSSSWFCQSCGLACEQFLSKSRPLLFARKRQPKHVQELQEKIIAAIQLTTVLARKKASRNTDKDEDFNHHTNTILQMKAVDKVRELLIGERTWKYLEMLNDKEEEADTLQIKVEDISAQLGDQEDVHTEEEMIPIPPSSKPMRASELRLHPKPRPRFPCDICGAILTGAFGVRLHKQRVHFGIKRFACMECGRGFRTEWDLDFHLRTHNGERPFSCDLCGDSFISKLNLNRHLRLAHQKTPKGSQARKGGPYDCELCGKVLSSRFTRYWHKRVKHRGVRPHACSYCQKKFAHRRELIVHIRKHTGDRPFNCSSCGVGFTSQPCWKYHVLRCQSANCQQKMSLQDNESAPLLHPSNIQIKHEFPSSSLPANPAPISNSHSCFICLQTFESPATLKQHIQMHVLNQPYVCDFCPRRYKEERYLQLHVLKAHPEKTTASKRLYRATLDSLINPSNGLWKEADGVLYFCDLKIQKGPDNTWKCPLADCLYSRASRLVLVQHINRNHVDSSQCSHPCGQCEKKFFYQSDLIHHEQEMHKKGTKRRDWSSLIKSSNGLWKEENGVLYFRNLKIERGPGRKWQCPLVECSYSQRMRPALFKHINRTHVDPSYCSHQCGQCEKRFFYQYDLILHEEEVHMEGNQRISKGNQHVSKYGSLVKASNGLWKEENGALFFCGIKIEKGPDNKWTCHFAECLSSHQRRSLLIKHINRNHLDPSQCPYQCDQCEKRFFYRSDLFQHGQDTHGGIKLPVLKQTTEWDSSSVETDNGLPKGPTEKDESSMPAGRKEGAVGESNCDICGKMFSSKQTLYWHKRVKHRGVKPHACSYCQKKFARRIEMLTHTRIHTREACANCGRRFATKEKLDQHLQKFKTSNCAEVQKFECTLCRKTFYFKHNLNAHALKSHPGKTVKAHTENFESLIKAGNGLWREAEGNLYFCDLKIEKDPENKWTCPLAECLYSNQRRFLLIQHINRTHVDPSNYSHGCNQCDQKFYYETDLREHIQEKHEGGYPCDICGTKLSSRQTFNFHKRTQHRSQLPYSCKYCGKGFTQRFRMISHEKTHEEAEKVSKYSNTENATIEANRRDGFTSEVLKWRETEGSWFFGNTAVKTDQEGKLMCPCNQCLFSSVTSSALSAHIKTEHAELALRPFTCDVCSERFLLEKDLRKHTLVKHSAPPDTCSSQSDEELAIKVEELKDEPCSDDEEDAMQDLDGELVSAGVENGTGFVLPEALWNPDEDFDPFQIF